jgi:hypothetical protein
VSWALNEKLLEKFGKRIQSKDIGLEWNSGKNNLSVTLPTFDTSIYEFLNNDEYLTKTAANALKKIYQYSGKFCFIDYWDFDFPF